MRKYIGLNLASAALLTVLGCSGDKGDKGDPGEPGEAGAEGPQGPAGPAGPVGADGEAGAPGANADGGPGSTVDAGTDAGPAGDPAAALTTTTRIKHLVVIFGENISFDHYFGTYPKAANPFNSKTMPGDPVFGTTAPTGTPNNLVTPLDVTAGFTALANVDLLNKNPNFQNVAALQGGIAANPFRLDPVNASTTDQGHNYTPEQSAFDNLLMDAFPASVGATTPPPVLGTAPAAAGTQAAVMAYFDGNTVSAMWTYAQEGALNDNSWTTNFGPSTPGAINLISGQTNGMVNLNHMPLSGSHAVADGNGGFTMIGDTDPVGDVCSTAVDQNLFSGRNIGDLLNGANITWGWFEGGFDLGVVNANGTTGCNRATEPTAPNFVSASADYIPHHQPFQYYASTQNNTHARPTSVASIGYTNVPGTSTKDQYDSHDFFDAIGAGNFPAVSYIKAPAYEDGHAGYSNPLDEQNFIVKVVRAIQATPEWADTAIVFAYDDSDGWYDHQAPPIVNRSTTTADTLNGPGMCTTGMQQMGMAATPTTMRKGADGNPAQGRCGYGTRIPLLVLSPFAKKNFIDHTLTDQSSVLKFVEDNWLTGARIQASGSFDEIAGTIENMFSFP
jgi:phospholipase C